MVSKHIIYSVFEFNIGLKKLCPLFPSPQLNVINCPVFLLKKVSPKMRFKQVGIIVFC